jgi:hypothetical protein
MVREGLVDRDHQFARHRVVDRLALHKSGDELDPPVEGDHDRVRQHSAVGLEVPADAADVRTHLRALVPQEFLLVIPTDARDRGEAVQLLAVDGEAVDSSTPLAHLQCGQAQGIAIGHGFSLVWEAPS